MSESLKQLEAREKTLRADLSEVQRLIHKEKLRLIERASGFKPGMVIELGGKKAMIESLDTSFGTTDSPWAQVRYIRKDGQPAERTHNIFGLKSAGAKAVPPMKDPT